MKKKKEAIQSNSDYCMWTPNPNGIFPAYNACSGKTYSPGDDGISPDVPDFTYCMYCGKKIQLERRKTK